MNFEFDLFVVGAGSAGVRAARMAAQRGARVAVAEASAPGGTCVNLGCIPKKLYSYSAHFADDFRDAAGFGWELGETRFNWETLKHNRALEITRLNGVYRNLLANSGARLVNGRATLMDPHTVLVSTPDGEQRFSANHILVATGGRPSVPDFPGSQYTITSDQVFDLDPFPNRLVVVGGGYIACEFASIFNGLGSRVMQLYRGEQVLRGFDDDVRRHVAQEMDRHGVGIRTNCDIVCIEKSAAGLLVQLQDGTTLAADAVLCATGRVPNVAGLGLEALGIAQGDAGQIKVDDDYRSSVPSILAAGDVIGRVQLTPVALGEAMVIVDRLFGSGRRQFGYDYIPTAVFTHPNIGTVGYTEAQARAEFGQVTIFRSEFRGLKHTLGGRNERTMMKLVVDTKTDRVVGLHMVGADAGEVVQGFAVAIKAGATKALFDATVGIHPTVAEEFVTMREPVK